MVSVDKARALGACNSGYAGCVILTGNVACSNCAAGFNGQYGYVDQGGAGYCCIDTKASGVGAMAAQLCYDTPTCTLTCDEYTNNKRSCWYDRSFDNSRDCSTNLTNAGWPYVKSCAHSFYQCAPGYIWDHALGCGSSTSNYGEYCGCIKGCGLEEYMGFSQSGYDECVGVCDAFDEGECMSGCQNDYDTCADNCYATGGGWDCINTGCYFKKVQCENNCTGFSWDECAESCGRGCSRCPAAGREQSGATAYGWGADSQEEVDYGGFGQEIGSCRVVPGRLLQDDTGEFEYTSTCWYSE